MCCLAGYRMPCNNLDHPEDYEGPGAVMPDNVRECMQQNWGGASFGIIAGNKVNVLKKLIREVLEVFLILN